MQGSMPYTPPLPGRQNPEQVDSAAFQQLITQQQWTEGRPPQQWRLQNYVCHVLEKKIVNLNAKKKKKTMAVLGLSASFYELNRTSRFFPGPALPIRSLVLTCCKRCSKKIISANVKAKKIFALRYELESLKAETEARGSVKIRAAHGASRRGTSTKVQGEVYTLEKKSRRARFAFCSEQFPSKLCGSTFLQEYVSTSALAPSLLL